MPVLWNTEFVNSIRSKIERRREGCALMILQADVDCSLFIVKRHQHPAPWCRVFANNSPWFLLHRKLTLWLIVSARLISVHFFCSCSIKRKQKARGGGGDRSRTTARNPSGYIQHDETSYSVLPSHGGILVFWWRASRMRQYCILQCGIRNLTEKSAGKASYLIKQVWSKNDQDNGTQY